MMVRYRQSLGTEEDYILYAVDEMIRNKLRTESKFENEKIEILREFGLVDEDDDMDDGDEANVQPNGRRVHRREDKAVRVRTGANKTSIEREIEMRLLETRIVQLQDRQEHFRLRKAITQQLSDS
jgi:hypothetical protein